MSTTETLTRPLATLALRSDSPAGASNDKVEAKHPTSQVRAKGKTWLSNESPYPYSRFLPTFDPTLHLPPLEPFEHTDPGHAALSHSDPLAFLAEAEVEELTPHFGSEVSGGGFQLSSLTTEQRQQLALFVAQRGVVVFRDQDFVDQDPEWQLRDWGASFGRLHIHPTSGQPREFPELHLVYRDGEGTFNFEQAERLTTSLWHSDVTYELQPPGLTTLFLYDSPYAGGDTGYADQRAAYNHLSPSFRAYLETLEATHSGVEQAEHSRKGSRGGVVKRDPVVNVHPIVRRHPVTGEKALFVNPQFTRKIVGLKQEESDAILNLLYDHIQKGADFQVRLRWKARSVVLWDNRITAHTAIVDFKSQGGRRHGARITPQAERPIACV